MYVTICDEEGFDTDLIGPFPSYEHAQEWVDKMEAKYEGHLQQPFQILTPTDPADFSIDLYFE